MSTTAYIGIKKADGSVYGGWMWSDGGNFRDFCKSRTFHVLENIKALVCHGMWKTIISQKFGGRKWFEEHGYILNDINRYYTVATDSHVVEAVGKEYIPTEDATWVDGFLTFPNVSSAIACGADCVYVYNPDTDKWIRG